MPMSDKGRITIAHTIMTNLRSLLSQKEPESSYLDSVDDRISNLPYQELSSPPDVKLILIRWARERLQLYYRC